jgi:hypothetical protein
MKKKKVCSGKPDRTGLLPSKKAIFRIQRPIHSTDPIDSIHSMNSAQPNSYPSHRCSAGVVLKQGEGANPKDGRGVGIRKKRCVIIEGRTPSAPWSTDERRDGVRSKQNFMQPHKPHFQNRISAARFFAVQRPGVACGSARLRTGSSRGLA